MKDASLARKSDPGLRTYAGLLKRVRETLILGRKKIDELKVQTYWETGRLIHTHLLLTKERAGYGERVIEKLSKPLEVGQRLLERTLQFYRQFPRIPSGRTELNWTHYRVLSGIHDEKKRLALEARAGKEKWTAEELEEWIRRQDGKAGGGGDGKPVELLVPQKGRVGIYRIVEVSGKLHWDRGFASYRELSAARQTFPNLPSPLVGEGGGEGWGPSNRIHPPLHPLPSREGMNQDGEFLAARAPHFKAGDFVRLRGEDPLEKASDGQRSDLYTYETEVLRGVDAPELGTPEGESAKRFVESLFRKASKITITTKPDKWDRYLSDVFLEMPATESSAGKPGGEVIFLNNPLLEKGHAVRHDKFRLED